MNKKSLIHIQPYDDIETVIPLPPEEAKAYLREPSRLQNYLGDQWDIAPNYRVDIPSYRCGRLTEISTQAAYTYEMTVTEPSLFGRGLSRLRNRPPTSYLNLGIHWTSQTPDISQTH